MLFSVKQDTVGLTPCKSDEPKRRKFNQHKAYGVRLSSAYNELQTRLNTLQYINPMVNEIYLYSDISKRVLSGDGIKLFSELEGAQWLEYLHSGKAEQIWFLSRGGSGDAPTVITLVRPYVSAKQIGSVQGCVVVKMLADNVLASLEQNVNISGSEIYFIDSVGNMYTNNDSEKSLDATVLEQIGDKAVYHARHHRNIFQGSSQYSGWRYLNVVERGSGAGLGAVILLIGVGVLAISLLAALISNKYTIKPLDNLLKEVTAQFSKGQSDGDTAWDINSLKKMFEGILSDRVHMQDQLKQAAPALKWRILSDIVQGERKDYQELIPYFEMVGIHLYPQNYLVAVIEIDEAESVSKAVLEELTDYVEGLLNQGDSSGAVFKQGKNTLAAIVSYADDTEDLLLNGLAVFDMVKETIKQNYPFTVGQLKTLSKFPLSI